MRQRLKENALVICLLPILMAIAVCFTIYMRSKYLFAGELDHDLLEDKLL